MKPTHHYIAQSAGRRAERTLCGRPWTEDMSWSPWTDGGAFRWASSGITSRKCGACARVVKARMAKRGEVARG